MAELYFRVFVSSPGDVGDERRVAVRVLERLQGKYGAVLAVEPIVWEHEPVRATATFQHQIRSPAESDAVVCILWSRLGTRLPAEFHRADGSAYESGTAFEFETASEACERDGRPDLLVYRKTAPPIVDVRDRDKREQRSQDWDRLAAYLDRWFRNPDGSFKAGFTVFERPDEFEDLLERHLDDLIRNRLATADRLTAAEETIAPTWLAGSPFRGLEVFDVEHAGIFHGRTRAIGEVEDRLSRRANEGAAFLLVYGMSGSGKSSLVRAGVLPAITEPGVIEGIGLWRYCILRPSQGRDPVSLLLAALAGPGALTEIAEGDFTLDELATLVRESPERIVAPLRGALSRAAESVREKERLTGTPQARIAVVVDQFEELFLDERIEGPYREAFVGVLGALARSGLAWVICTMRSDFFHRCSEVPALVELKDGLGSYELLPPTAPEIAQMIRNPARAAGLRFEEDPQEGRLDDVLHQAASRDPASLPLLEFVLDALYEASGKGRVLTFAAYRALDRLEGAIAKRADEVVQDLPNRARAALPAVLRALVTVSAEAGTATARLAPMAQLRATPERADLVDALVAARLLVTDGEGDGVVVRIAHEALLNRWPRAREIIRESRDDLLARERVRTDRSLWERNDRGPDLLLPPGKRLAEALDLLGRRREELDVSLVEYVEASRVADDRRRRRRATWVVGAFVVLVGLLGATAWQGWEARKQTEIARTERGIAEDERLKAQAQQRIAEEQTRKAERQAALALSRQLATHSRDALGRSERQLALLLAVEASRRAQTQEAHEVLAAGLRETALLERTLWLPASGYSVAAFSPAGDRLAVYRERRGQRPTLTKFDVSNGAELSTRKLGAEVARLAWGRELVGVAPDKSEMVVFDGDTGRARRVPLEDCGELRDVGADAAGTIIVSCYNQLRRLTPRAEGWDATPIEGLRVGFYGSLSGNGRHALFGASSLSVWHDGEPALAELPLKTGPDARARPNRERFAIDDTGRLVAVPTGKGTLVWALDGPPLPVAALPAFDDINDLAFSPDGRRLAVVLQTGRVEIWEVGQVQPIARPLAATANVGPISALALAPDRSRLAAGTTTGLVTVERIGGDADAVDVLNGWPGRILAPLFASGQPGASPAASAVVVLDEGGRLVMRRVADREPVGAVDVPGLRSFFATQVGEDAVVRGLIDREGGLTVASITDGPSLVVDPGTIASRAGQRETLPTVSVAGAISPDGRLAAFVEGDPPDLSDHVTLVELPGGKQTRIQLTQPSFLDRDAGYELAVASRPGEAVVAVGLRGRANANPVVVWSSADRSLTRLWEGLSRYDDLFDIAISGDGDRIAAATLVGLLVWEKIDGSWQQETTGVNGERVVFRPGGRSVVVGRRDGSVVHVEIPGGATRELDGGLDRTPELALDGNGRFLVAATDRDVRVWDLETGEPAPAAENHLTDGVEWMAFEDDGRRLAVSAMRGPVMGWSLDDAAPKPVDLAGDEQTLKPLRCLDPSRDEDAFLVEFPRLELSLCTAMVDTGGVRLHVGLRDTWAVLWQVPVEDPIERACRRAGRNLSADEWTRLVGESVEQHESCPGQPPAPEAG